MGSQRRISLLKPVALLLVFAVLQVYVLVTPAKATTSNSSASENVRFGQLLMSENQSALVNGTSAITGTTIFSGTQLQTPDGVAATVNLGTLGRLSVDPNTLLSLTFDKESVNVDVKAGNAVLTTNAGVTGTLTTAEGQKLMTNSAANSTVGRKAARRDWDDKTIGAVLFASAVAIALIVVVALDDDDESPNNP